MSLVRQQYTKPLPKDAELFTQDGQQYARWRGRDGKRKTARVTTGRDGQPRIVLRSNKLSAQYRNGAGRVERVATGCRTKEAAQTLLHELNVRADKVRAGAWTAAEDSVLDHQATPIGEHVDAYLDALKNKRGKGGKRAVNRQHYGNVATRLRRIVAECKFTALRDLSRPAMERWADLREAEGMGARTLNGHLAALCAFGNWCVSANRLVSNPFARPPKRDERTDPRRKRRALTEDELRRLLRAAKLRPIAEQGRAKVVMADKPRDPKSRRTWKRETLTADNLESAYRRGLEALQTRPDELAKLERAGAERALIYKTLVLTGLRKSELAALTIGCVELEGQVPIVRLDANAAKSGQAAEIPLRADLVEDLRSHLRVRLQRAQDAARNAGEPLPVHLSSRDRLFVVPDGLVKIMDRDLLAAGIARIVVGEDGAERIDKRDERGRTVDVHALRHTFGTHLSKNGVAPRTAQAAMRHSSIELTMNTYTDPRLLDLSGALEQLPALPLDDGNGGDRALATGTDDAPSNYLADRIDRAGERNDAHASAARTLTPMLTRTPGNSGAFEALSGKSDELLDRRDRRASVACDERKQHVARGDKMRTLGLEPRTHGLKGRCSTD